MELYNVRLLTDEGLTEPRTVDLPAADGDDRDASGLILSPGWADLHAHLRDPGFPEKETLNTGAASAAFGGFTHVVAMANTNPVIDRADVLGQLVIRARTLPIRVSFVGALTTNLEGEQLTDAAGLLAAGAVALSDDGRHAVDSATLRRALTGAAEAGLPVFIHAQKEALGRAAQAESEAVAEALDVLRDAPGARLHVQHVSTAAAVELIRQAKDDGLAVTAEATPHHLTLTDRDAARMGPWGNVNPPLRSAADREAVRHAVAEGVIDVIATDHAPHDPASKAAGANGFHGFETAVGVVLGFGFDARVLYRACVQKPREIIGYAPSFSLPLVGGPAGPREPRGTCDASVRGVVGEGVDDWILIDPDLEWTVDPDSFRSRGRNTPFAGQRLKGRVVMTVCDGHVLFQRMAQRV